MDIVWVLEADESPVSKPYFFHEFSRGRCFLTWTDEFEFAKKFTNSDEVHEWTKKNHIHCGFRIRAYPAKIQTKRRV